MREARSRPPGGRARTAGPELGDERVRDLLLAVPRGDALADERLHPLGDGSVRLVERRLAVGHTSSASSSAALGVGRRRPKTRAERGRGRRRGRRRPDGSRLERALGCGAQKARSSSEFTAPTNDSTTWPCWSITNVSGNPSRPNPQYRPGTADDREREPGTFGEPACIAAKSFRPTPTTTRPSARLSRHTSSRWGRLLLARDAPGRPEVEDHRLPLQGARGRAWPS